MRRMLLELGVVAVVVASAVLAVGAFGSTFASTKTTGSAGPQARIAFASGSDGQSWTTINVMNADGSGKRNLTRNRSYDRYPAWSPDGRRIAFERCTEEREQSWVPATCDIYVMDADGSGQRNLTRNGSYDGGPVWSPDGRSIAFVSSRGGYTENGLSETFNIYVMNADGSGQRSLTRGGLNSVFDPVWSPDGRKIAFWGIAHPPAISSSTEIYVVNAGGGGQRNLTRDGKWDGYPTWSPDGRRIAFLHAGPSHTQVVYVMNADGSGKRNLSRDRLDNQSPVWSPDGRRIAFSSGAEAMTIFVMNADGSGKRTLTKNGDTPAWSPDGRRIAFVTEWDPEITGWDREAGEVYVINADGSGKRNLSRSSKSSEYDPIWSPTLR